MTAREPHHRFGDDYISPSEWPGMPSTRQRVAYALGQEPLEDARHLLQPVTLPPPATPLPPGPNPLFEYVVHLQGRFPIAAESLWNAFGDRATRNDLGFFRLWARRTDRSSDWLSGEGLPTAGRITAAALTWELSSLLSEGREAAEELGKYTLRAGERASEIGLTVVPVESPAMAAERAGRLILLRERYSQPIEMRLVPQGRFFPARQVWRTAYALGMEWGDMDLLHWRDPIAGIRLFSLSSLGQSGYFLPERAAEGEGVPGLSLSFELPLCPPPLAPYDRMAVALAYFRQKLGGRPLASDGSELDADALYEGRDALEEAVMAMTIAGLAPGSAAAEAFF